MWDPFTRRAITKLYGHNSSVTDLTVNDERQHLISLGMDKSVRVWDVKTYACVLSLFDKVKYRPEDRLTCIHFDTIKNCILLGSRKVNKWLFKTQEEIKTSHEHPISVAIYNKTFENVVSCDDGSFISVWDIENGELLSKFGEVHGTQKITAAEFDATGRRIITAGADGSVKIWNFSNGQCLAQCIYD